MGEVGKGGADRRRDPPHLILIAVRAASPGEVAAEKAIVGAPRHVVNMAVRHALADDVGGPTSVTGRSGKVAT